MSYKKIDTVDTTITRNLNELEEVTGNLYQSLIIIARRADQINIDIKEELNRKLEDFASYTDNLEEIFENREQIEISKHYEGLPKPVNYSIQEFINEEIYWRVPKKFQKKKKK
ncbi:MAG: DNA-directed RNA polymerase subunit omega [Bacteroidales bacterium]|nr:DNA-directed RNA polymerase subunit omega [Bacteroidales bacterium]